MAGYRRRRSVLARRAWRLGRELLQFGGIRLGGVILLAAGAALAEGAGILLLVPLLGLLGVAGSGRLAPAWWGIALPPLPLEAALGLYGVLVVAGAVVVAARTVVATRLRLAFVDHLRARLHQTLLTMEWLAFCRLRGSDITHTLTGDLARTGQGVDFVLSLAGWLAQALILLMVSLALSPALTLLGGVGMVMLMPIASQVNRHVYRLGQAAGEAGRQLQGELSDTLSGLRLIKTFNLEERRGATFGHALGELRRRQVQHQRALAVNTVVTRTLGALAAIGAVLVAVRGFHVGLADTLALMIAFARGMMLAGRVTDGWRKVIYALPAYHNAHALLMRCRAAAEPVAAVGGVGVGAEPPRLTRALVLESVTFRHDPNRAPALVQVSAVIAADATTAIIGPSGAGKSTLGDLLLGLIAPETGRITLDDLPLTPERRVAWRRRTGYLPQEPFLFHNTIRANLAVAGADLDDGMLWRRLAEAHADHFVRALPLGLDTVVGDRGARLSGGERQRLALARALLRDPALLVLDEPTSALDEASERQILTTLDRLRGRMTIVLITHRGALRDHADHVLHLAHGRVFQS